MSKEKDLLAEIEHQEAVIAEATERLKALNDQLSDLQREDWQNAAPTPAMLAVLEGLATGGAIQTSGTAITVYEWCRQGGLLLGSTVYTLARAGWIAWEGEPWARVARITDHGRAVLAKYQEGGGNE